MEKCWENFYTSWTHTEHRWRKKVKWIAAEPKNQPVVAHKIATMWYKKTNAEPAEKPKIFYKK